MHIKIHVHVLKAAQTFQFYLYIMNWARIIKLKAKLIKKEKFDFGESSSFSMSVMFF
jgi:hypothetical protein